MKGYVIVVDGKDKDGREEKGKNNNKTICGGRKVKEQKVGIFGFGV